VSRVALVALGAAVFLSGLDQTVVVSVLPRVVEDLHVSIAELDDAAWIVTAYLLGYTVALLPLGRMADVHGDRRVLVACALLFAGGSLWAALADGLWSLVAARAVQAVGGGGMVPIALAAAGPRRLVALGAVAAAAEAGAVLGPLYGAAFVDTVGWRAVFWVNVPLTALVVAAAWRPLGAGARAAGARVDHRGALLAALALVALTLALSSSLDARVRWLLAAAAVVAALGFARVQELVPRALLRRAGFAVANSANVVVGGALVVALVVVPVYANVVLGQGATEGGLTLLKLTALIPLGALLGGWIAARVPPGAVAAAGMAVAAGGFALLAADGVRTPALAVTGLGFGLVIAPYAAAALAAARGGAEAVAAASLTVSRTLGMTVGLAAVTAWGLEEFRTRAARFELPVQDAGESEAAYRLEVDRYRELIVDSALYVFDRLFLAASSLCLAAAIVSVRLRRSA
jgi:MFS family permease